MGNFAENLKGNRFRPPPPPIIPALSNPDDQDPGGSTHLPKFKFSVNFPIGLHVILQIQIKKKYKNAQYLM